MNIVTIISCPMPIKFVCKYYKRDHDMNRLQ